MDSISDSRDVTAERDVALARSALYDALAAGFLPPTETTLRRFADPAAVRGLAAGARLACANDEPRLLGALGDLCARARIADLAEWDAAHAALFGHTTRGRVVPYETEYGTGDHFRAAQELADIGGFLAAFGLRPNLSAHERIDHVSAECEMLAFLARKEAHALERGDRPMLDETRRAARLFLRDHLARFGRSFATSVVREDEGGVYAALARIFLEFLAAECRREGIPAGPILLALREDTLASVPSACGAEDAPIQIRRSPGGEPCAPPK
jgi:TorA maturation chaperone TorD